MYLSISFIFVQKEVRCNMNQLEISRCKQDIVYFNETYLGLELSEWQKDFCRQINTDPPFDPIGMEIKNIYCNGFFGRDYELNGAVIIDNGYDWVKIEKRNGYLKKAYFKAGWQLNEMNNLIKEWTRYK